MFCFRVPCLVRLSQPNWPDLVRPGLSHIQHLYFWEKQLVLPPIMKICFHISVVVFSRHSSSITFHPLFLFFVSTWGLLSISRSCHLVTAAAAGLEAEPENPARTSAKVGGVTLRGSNRRCLRKHRCISKCISVRPTDRSELP